MVRVVIVGATGRMGRTLVACARQMPGVVIVGAVDRGDNPSIGRDVGELAGIGPIGVQVVGELASALADGAADVIVDFSDPASTAANLAAAASARVAALVGTTGLPDGIESHATRASAVVPVMLASNTSLGVTLLTALVRECARLLPEDFDIEIVEAHHRLKVDAPSGTALRMGEVVAGALGRDLAECAVYGREGVTGERDASTIGFATVRGGDIVGDHTVMFCGIGERVEISHKAGGRMPYAAGSLRAARFLAGRRNGLYDMQDVLGLR